ncbi:DNA repair protein RecN [Ferroacidibacillus organovorans]|uniref:DNA repair protein RecN n=1 Tax=Ferroacidibacillus organovorans TaxID=1765683 RepID=A0A853KBU1_9BACL|nr:DNA repair protein RecN [Ferroacidibacillus organovorans]KYP81034.1 hypothetical protein AYJ22_09300 [Ferroacidibacillus organovorans]OAG94283.1 hypothetical protein AYW79_05995 [Ferroacidibacillus organovorans]
MLRHIRVTNLALIESLELAFEEGFTCLTGETGAGKSILLDAVGLLLGARASSELVRTGEVRAHVEGIFDLRDDVLQRMEPLLTEQGIELDDKELLISRDVNVNGKTVARVNGRLVSVQVLRQLGQMLVEQLGQHDHTSLMRKEEHLVLLDTYGRESLEHLLESYREAFSHLHSLERDLKRAIQSEKERVRKIDLLQSQIREIEDARLKPSEDVRLRELRTKMRHVGKLRSTIDDVYESIYEGTHAAQGIEAALFTLLEEIRSVLELDPSLRELLSLLEVAQVNVSEAASFIRAYRSSIDFQPEKLSRLEDRLALIERMQKKYGDTTEEITRFAKQAQEELDELIHHEERIKTLRDDLLQAQASVAVIGEALHEERIKVARELEREITDVLHALVMPNVALTFSIRRVEPRADGLDDLELLFSANRGEMVKPLTKIASGGELARLMLALSAVMTGKNPVMTLVFDEIDTGISGQAAQAVARFMKQIATRHQVFCVTHLAQTAAIANHHFHIEKTTHEGRTKTSVRELKEEDRVEELARMMGGLNASDTTRAQAMEMLGHSSH